MKHIYFLFIYLFLLFSCDNDSDLLREGEFSIQFKVDGVEDVFEQSTLITTARLAGYKESYESYTDNSKLIKGGEDFDMIAEMTAGSYDSNKLKSVKENIAQGKSSGLKFFATTKPMSSGFKYRVVIFEKLADNSLVYYTEKEFTTGQASDAITLYKTKRYKWIAYSFNNNQSIPEYSVDGNLLQTGNVDLLYANNLTGADLNYPAGQATSTILPITFKHTKARIGIEVDGRGMFTNEVKSFTASLSTDDETDVTFKKGNFNLLTGQFENLVSYDPLAVGEPVYKEYLDFENVNQFKDRLVRYIYSAADISVSGSKRLKVKFKTIEIQKSESTTFYTFNYESNPVVVSFSPNILKGQTANASLVMVESGVRINAVHNDLNNFNGLPNPVNFARGNLYVRNHNQPLTVWDNNAINDDTRFYAFRFHNTGKHNDNNLDLFFGRDRRTQGFSIGRSDLSNSLDPCVMVYPAASWVQITNSISSGGTNVLTPLGSAATADIRTYGSSSYNGINYNYVEYTGHSDSRGGEVNGYYPSKNLRLELNGWMQLNSLSGLTSFTDHRNAEPLIGLYKGYISSTSTVAALKITFDGTSGSVLNLSTSHEENKTVDGTTTMFNFGSIRCVRKRF